MYALAPLPSAHVSGSLLALSRLERVGPMRSLGETRGVSGLKDPEAKVRGICRPSGGL